MELDSVFFNVSGFVCKTFSFVTGYYYTTIFKRINFFEINFILKELFCQIHMYCIHTNRIEYELDGSFVCLLWCNNGTTNFLHTQNGVT